MSGELNRPFGPFVFLFNFIILFHKIHKVNYCKFSSRNVFNVTTNHNKTHFNKKYVFLPLTFDPGIKQKYCANYILLLRGYSPTIGISMKLF